MLISRFAHLTAKPKIHRGGPEQERSEGRVPGAITTKVSELNSMGKPVFLKSSGKTGKRFMWRRLISSFAAR